jgi:PDZ domain-containing protein
MNRHSLATLVAAAVSTAGAVAITTVPVPYVRYEPAVTVDLLAETRGEERVQVEGHRTYPAEGELRMTTIRATPPETGISLLAAMSGWLSDDEAVRPYDEVYGERDTAESRQSEAAVQMATSQDVAVAAALIHLDFDVPMVPVVGPLTPGLPADGALVERDRYVSIGGEPIRTWDDIVRIVSAARPGVPLEFVVKRDGKRLEIPVTPRRVDGRVVVGVQQAFDFELPFEVEIRVPDGIGGPSAGLMFALSVVDALTPGSMTGGAHVAGTGTITPEGEVGPIGGIQQKIAGARRAGAGLFLVPALNCDEAVSARPGDMRLTAVQTLDEAEKAVTTFGTNPRADLPTCDEVLKR